MASATRGYPPIPTRQHPNPYSCLRRPARGTAVTIRCEDAHGQDTALFALPAEIRTAIYEYVVGSGVIHIRERDCEKHDNWTVIRRYKKFDIATENQYRFVDSVTKLTHSTCQISYEWENRYATSKRPEEHAFCPTPEEDLEEYTKKHNQCVSHVLRDFTSRNYTGGCSISHPENLQANGCTACQAQYNRWTDTYGLAPNGLKKLHATSGVQLSFLLSCRQVYKEAWHLPFLQYTFDFPSTEIMANFGQRLLYPHQTELIHATHLCDGPRLPLESKTRATIPFDYFRGLRTLRLSFYDDGELYGNGKFPDLSAYNMLIGSGQLRSVEVVNSYDNDPYGQELKSENRKLAEWIEGTLAGKIEAKDS